MVGYFFLQNASAQAALQAAQVHALTNNSVTPSGTPTTPLTNGQDIQGGPNTVLRVIVEHMIYPISLDILYLVCLVFLVSKIDYTVQLLFADIPPVRTSPENSDLHKKQ